MPRRVQMCKGKSYVAAKRRTCHLRLKKEGLAGRDPTTCGFERQCLTPTPLRPVDTYTSYYRREETIYNRSGWCTGRSLEFKTTGQSGVGDKALAFKPTGRGFAPRQRFVFFTRRGRRRVSIYQSYYIDIL